MARHYIGLTARGPTTLKNVRSEDGYPLLLMEEAETRKITLNLAALLETGESISSATVAADGVTAAISTSSPNIVLTLSSPTAWGEAIVTITLSNGEIIRQTVRARQNASAFNPAEVAYAL
jgi:hypothetical protein